MARIFKLIVGLIVGIVAHKAASPIIDEIEARDTGRLWTRSSRYIVGVLATAPVFLLLNDDDTDGLLAYLLSFMSTGVGVAVGYWLDELE